MRRSLYNITSLALFVLPATFLFAQQPTATGRHSSHRNRTAPAVPSPVLKVTVDKKKILIGEPIQLMLEATVPANATLLWPGLDSLPHFDWLERHPVDSTTQAGGERYYRQYLSITSFDSGAWAIPPLPFVSGNKTFFTDSVPINIGYTKVDPAKDYHDIKDIIDVPNPFAPWFKWIVTLVSLGGLAILILLVRKKKLLKTGPPTALPRLTPYEEAIRQLDELERQQLPADGAIKTYYTRLGDIFRLYLYRRIGIAGLAETSEELIGQLRRQPLPPPAFSSLSDTLRMSDFVKFAKYQPELAETETHYRSIRSAIDAFEGIIEEQERTAAANALANPDRTPAGTRPVMPGDRKQQKN